MKFFIFLIVASISYAKNLEPRQLLVQFFLTEGEGFKPQLGEKVLPMLKHGHKLRFAKNMEDVEIYPYFGKNDSKAYRIGSKLNKSAADFYCFLNFRENKWYLDNILRTELPYQYFIALASLERKKDKLNDQKKRVLNFLQLGTRNDRGLQDHFEKMRFAFASLQSFVQEVFFQGVITVNKKPKKENVNEEILSLYLEDLHVRRIISQDPEKIIEVEVSRGAGHVLGFLYFCCKDPKRNIRDTGVYFLQPLGEDWYIFRRKE